MGSFVLVLVHLQLARGVFCESILPIYKSPIHMFTHAINMHITICHISLNQRGMYGGLVGGD